MLILSRQRDQALLLGDPDKTLARIIIADIRGDKVRLGVEAPRFIQVHREEIAEEILRSLRGHGPDAARLGLVERRDALLSELNTVNLEIQKIDAGRRQLERGERRIGKIAGNERFIPRKFA